MKHPFFNNNRLFYRASRLQSAARFVFEQKRLLFSFEKLQDDILNHVSLELLSNNWPIRV